MEIIGPRALLCPTAIALCPPRHLLAAATAARGGNNSGGGAATAARGGNNSGGGGSWIDVFRLWRVDGEKDVGRPLKRVASIRDCDGPFHRLACEPDVDTTKVKLSGARRVSWSEEDGSSSSASLSFIMHDFNGMPKPLTVVDKKAPAVEFKDVIEPLAAGMRNELDPLIKDHVAKQRSSKLDLQHDTKGDSKDWEFIPSEEIASKLPDPSTDEMWNALILKPDKLTGLVMGLAFNNQYPNMLASAAYGETLNIHYVDYPSELATRGSKKLQTQMMFLEWHPFLPAILASTCDIGDPKIWDLRENSWKIRYQQDDKRKCICSEVHWNPSNPWMLAAASKDSFPMKVWPHFRGLHAVRLLPQMLMGQAIAGSWIRNGNRVVGLRLRLEFVRRSGASLSPPWHLFLLRILCSTKCQLKDALGRRGMK
ncbi:unnamed protein product [Miscanthus lutarioriparius]|uniref:Uncharacterized protein n=1 Tax=Miscanthus lutarioriparius TaxID=422564 RepID=A0A811NWJ1_9POAL|nr:unnamed protein product [Miscanthus lutarioriparius]